MDVLLLKTPRQANNKLQVETNNDGIVNAKNTEVSGICDNEVCNETPAGVDMSEEFHLDCMCVMTEYLASYSMVQYSLRMCESLLDQAIHLPANIGLPSLITVTISRKLSNLSRDARAMRRAGARYRHMETDGLLIQGVNWALGILGWNLVKLEESDHSDEIDSTEMEVDPEILDIIAGGYFFREGTGNTFTLLNEDNRNKSDIEETNLAGVEEFYRFESLSSELSDAALAEYVSDDDSEYEPTVEDIQEYEDEIYEEYEEYVARHRSSVDTDSSYSFTETEGEQTFRFDESVESENGREESLYDIHRNNDSLTGIRMVPRKESTDYNSLNTTSNQLSDVSRQSLDLRENKNEVPDTSQEENVEEEGKSRRASFVQVALMANINKFRSQMEHMGFGKNQGGEL